ncbi:GNAT family N-acetyltransferase [Actinacidiphila soli]|uniref:GNAT family N-acetyltransferase n=1 Tax=Actinacidiphila soli TaxID=2487275 RepID=UPI000FCBF2DE|nr:GNAT family N-acetyltransferase [Actinacidiphila soli]
MTKPPLRRLTVADDLAGCLKLAVNRDWGAEEHKWRFLFTHGEVYGIDAPDGDGLAGTTILTRYGSTLAAVSMVLVAARYEGRGFGRHLMTHAIDQAGDATVTLHATDRGRPLYEKLGFRPIGTVITHVGRFTPTADHPSGTGTVRPATEADLPALLTLDAEVFGADRAPLLRRLPHFAEHTVLAESGSPDGRITGYAAAWRNIDTLVIGPVIADTPDTARQLIAALARNAGPDTAVRLDLRTDRLAETDGLHLWAAAQGVLPGFPNTLMVLGDRDLPGDDRRRHTPLMVALG